MFRTSLLAVTALALLGATGASANITTFDPQGSVGTASRSVNKGAVTGWYYDSNYTTHGFLRASDGTITTFDAATGATGTSPNSIVNGKIVGYYEDSNGGHGFFRAVDGTITTFDVTGAAATFAGS